MPRRPSLRRLSPLYLNHYIYGDGFNAAWLVVRDPCAGRKHVYTVHRISLVGSKASQVIGRELPLKLAREIVSKDIVR